MHLTSNLLAMTSLPLGWKHPGAEVNAQVLWSPSPSIETSREMRWCEDMLLQSYPPAVVWSVTALSAVEMTLPPR